MMKSFNLRSYITGIVTGIFIIVLFIGGKSLLKSSSESAIPSNLDTGSQERDNYRQENAPLPTGDAIDADRIQRISERFGMTIEELQEELDIGKTLPEIAEERGIDFSGGMRQGRFDNPIQESGATTAPGTPENELPSDNDTL